MNPTVGSAQCHFTDRIFPFVVTASGTGAGVSLLAGTMPYLGQAQMTSGTASNGQAMVGTALNGLVFSGKVWTFEALVQVPVLSDGTNSFKVHCGFLNGTNGGDESLFFKYIHSFASGHWTCQAVDGETAPDPVDSGVPVVAGQWYRLKIMADMTAGWAKFYIDGALVATLTVGLPIGATTGCGLVMTKTAGTTARTLLGDWLEVGWRRATRRVVASGDWASTGTWEDGVVPGDGDGVHVPAPHEVVVSTAVTVNQTDPTKAPFQIDNGARVLVGRDGSGSLTVTQNTMLVLNGDIDVWSWAKFGPVLMVPFCAGRVRRMVPSAEIIIGDDGFKYRW